MITTIIAIVFVACAYFLHVHWPKRSLPSIHADIYRDYLDIADRIEFASSENDLYEALDAIADFESTWKDHLDRRVMRAYSDKMNELYEKEMKKYKIIFRAV